MKKNVGTIDKSIRVFVGLAVLLIGCLKYHSLWSLFGIIPILTATFEYCPLYSLLHVCSCKGDGGSGDCCCR